MNVSFPSVTPGLAAGSRAKEGAPAPLDGFMALLAQLGLATESEAAAPAPETVEASKPVPQQQAVLSLLAKIGRKIERESEGNSEVGPETPATPEQPKLAAGEELSDAELTALLASVADLIAQAVPEKALPPVAAPAKKDGEAAVAASPRALPASLVLLARALDGKGAMAAPAADADVSADGEAPLPLPRFDLKPAGEAKKPVVQLHLPSADHMDKARAPQAPASQAAQAALAMAAAAPAATADDRRPEPSPFAMAIAPGDTGLQPVAGGEMLPVKNDSVVERQLDLANDSEWLDTLARDIARAAQSDTELRFRLNPEHLGSLKVELVNGAQGTTVKLTADSEAARAVLADAQPRLIAEARAQGLRISEAQVELGGQGAGQRQPSEPVVVVRTAAQRVAAEVEQDKPAASSERYA